MVELLGGADGERQLLADRHRPARRALADGATDRAALTARHRGTAPGTDAPQPVFAEHAFVSGAAEDLFRRACCCRAAAHSRRRCARVIDACGRGRVRGHARADDRPSVHWLDLRRTRLWSPAASGMAAVGLRLIDGQPGPVSAAAPRSARQAVRARQVPHDDCAGPTPARDLAGPPVDSCADSSMESRGCRVTEPVQRHADGVPERSLGTLGDRWGWCDRRRSGNASGRRISRRRHVERRSFRLARLRRRSPRCAGRSPVRRHA